MLYGETITRVRRKPVRDPYSNEESPGTWDDADTVSVHNAAVAPSQSFAVPDPTRSQVVSTMSVFCPPNADVQPGDRIRAASGLWSVETQMLPWRNPYTGSAPGNEFALKREVG